MRGLLLGYWIGGACLWLVMSACLVFRKKIGACLSNRLTTGQISLLILTVALLARLIVVFTSEPRLSDDIWRYIHDGRVMVELGQSPYAAAPSDSPLAYRGNYPDLVSIYQPTSEYVFAALAWVGPNAKTFRLGFIAFDLLIVALLLRWLSGHGDSPWWAALYAWHPLAISEVAWSGHQDVIGIALTLLALVLADEIFSRGACTALRGQTPLKGQTPKDTAQGPRPNRAQASDGPRATMGWMIAAGLAIGAAVAVKPIIAGLALPWGWSLRHQPRAMGVMVASALIMLAGLYLPFVFTQAGLGGMFQTVRHFIADWAFNGSIHRLVQTLVHTKSTADWIMAGALGCVLLVLTLKDVARPRAAVVYFLAALILSSTAHPWYLLWGLALVPLAFSLTVWTWSLSIGWAYFAWICLERGGEFAVPTWLVWCEYLPVFVALVIEWISGTMRNKLYDENHDD